VHDPFSRVASALTVALPCEPEMGNLIVATPVLPSVWTLPLTHHPASTDARIVDGFVARVLIRVGVLQRTEHHDADADDADRAEDEDHDATDGDGFAAAGGLRRSLGRWRRNVRRSHRGG